MRIAIIIRDSEGVVRNEELITDNPYIVIGRASGDLRIPDPRCSRIHAIVSLDEAGCLKLVDMSRNGTFVKSEITSWSTSTFPFGTDICIGKTKILFLRHGD